MFEDSLFTSSNQRYPRGWTALVSFAVQTLFVGTLIVVPMLFTDALPFRTLREIVQIPPVPRRAQTDAKPNMQPKQREDTNRETIRVPPSVPRLIMQVIDPPPQGQNSGKTGPPDLSEIGNADSGDSQVSSLLKPGPTITPTVQKTPAKRWKVSGGVEEGLLIRNVRPIYPRLAQAAGVQGEVVLQAVIGKDGRIENLHAISGNPLLVKAALDAVQQWRYRPYLLNGEPVEIETQITVRFTVS